MNTRKKAIAGSALAGALFLSVGLAAPANAQVEQDGLVNVAIGDITISDINIGVAANIAANVCGELQVGPIAVLGAAVDRSGDTEVVCTIGGQTVSLEQN